MCKKRGGGHSKWWEEEMVKDHSDVEEKRRMLSIRPGPSGPARLFHHLLAVQSHPVWNMMITVVVSQIMHYTLQYALTVYTMYLTVQSVYELYKVILAFNIGVW